MILNMITTSVMIKLGRVKGNRMVNMQLSNAKLVDSEGFPPATHKEKNGERVPAVIETRDLTPAFAHHASR